MSVVLRVDAFVMLSLKCFRREHAARRESQRLMNTLEEYKRRCENSSEDVLNATKPIARQLEDEIAKNNEAAARWEKQERELTSSIGKTARSDFSLLPDYRLPCLYVI